MQRLIQRFGMIPNFGEFVNDSIYIGGECPRQSLPERLQEFSQPID